MNLTFEQAIQEDRQWPRHCRISHAKLMRKQATDVVERKVWQDVLEANARSAEDKR